jgi:hypothetical protein
VVNVAVYVSGINLYKCSSHCTPVKAESLLVDGFALEHLDRVSGCDHLLVATVRREQIQGRHSQLKTTIS